MDVVAEASRVTLETRSADETRRVGAWLGRAALPLPPEGLVVGLHGPLGAGKTVLVQGVARGIGVPASTAVVSPTFTIARDYAAPGPPAVRLQHVDAYRLTGRAELEGAGFEEMWGDGRLTCVEWAERVEDAMPEHRLDVELEPDFEGGAPEEPAEAEPPRRIVVRATGPRATAVLRRFAALATGRAA